MSDPDNRVSNAAFINEARHSLRQPLLALSLNVAALQLQVDNPAAVQTATRLRDSAELLTSLIEDVLLVARLRFGAGAGAGAGAGSGYGDSDSERVACRWPDLIEELARQRAAMGSSCSVVLSEPVAAVPESIGFQADRSELLQLLHRAVDLAFLAYAGLVHGDQPELAPRALTASAESGPCVVAATLGSVLKLRCVGPWRSAPAGWARYTQARAELNSDSNLQLRLRLATHLADAQGFTLQMDATPGSPPSILLAPSIA